MDDDDFEDGPKRSKPWGHYVNDAATTDRDARVSMLHSLVIVVHLFYQRRVLFSLMCRSLEFRMEIPTLVSQVQTEQQRQLVFLEERKEATVKSNFERVWKKIW